MTELIRHIWHDDLYLRMLEELCCKHEVLPFDDPLLLKVTNKNLPKTLQVSDGEKVSDKS